MNFGQGRLGLLGSIGTENLGSRLVTNDADMREEEKSNDDSLGLSEAE